MAARGSDVFVQRGVAELLAGLFAEILDKEIDYALFEPQLDRDILAKNNLTFKHVVIGEDQFDAGHKIFELLVVGEGSKGVDGLRVANQVGYGFFGKFAVAGNLENHLALNLGKMLVGLGKLDQDIKLLFGNDVHG